MQQPRNSSPSQPIFRNETNQKICYNKRTNLSNSTMSLSSPNKDLESNVRNGKHRSSDNESDATKSSEGTSESDEELSGESSETKPSSENQSSYYDEDDDAVQVRSIKETLKKKTRSNGESGERAAPVPQVRFSKLVSHMKK